MAKKRPKRPKWEWDPLDNDLLRALVQEEREPPLVLAEVFACSVRQIRAVCRRLGVEYFAPAEPIEAPDEDRSAEDAAPFLGGVDGADRPEGDRPDEQGSDRGPLPAAVAGAEARPDDPGARAVAPPEAPGREVIPVEETRLELPQLVREVRVILEAAGPLQLTALMRQLQVAGVFNSEKEVLLAIAKDRGITELAPRRFRLVS
jgi:hypothetical protein